jgi:hypothetical protein
MLSTLGRSSGIIVMTRMDEKKGHSCGGGDIGAKYMDEQSKLAPILATSRTTRLNYQAISVCDCNDDGGSADSVGAGATYEILDVIQGLHHHESNHHERVLLF